MKAVVVEIKDGYAVMLQDDGSFIKLEDRKFTIGDVVNMEEKKMPGRGRFKGMLATAVIFFMLMGGGAWAYFTPYYYVSLDVNPSVNMIANYFERVIGVEAVNEDAIAVLEGLDLKNKKVEEAIVEAVDSITEEGYLSEGNGEILIASIAKNNDKAERLAGKLKGAVEEDIEENGVQAEISAGALGYEMVQAAKALDITPGKYNIITNLLGEEVTEENMNESIRDLMARYTETKGNGVKTRNRENVAVGQDEDDDESAEQTQLKEKTSVGKPEDNSNTNNDDNDDNDDNETNDTENDSDTGNGNNENSNSQGNGASKKQ